jgi:hypothetical protein
MRVKAETNPERCLSCTVWCARLLPMLDTSIQAPFGINATNGQAFIGSKFRKGGFFRSGPFRMVMLLFT